MSNIYNWNIPISIPPVFDTTPCLDYMVAYQECLIDAGPHHMQVFHPNWPTMWPRLLTDGKLRPDLMENRTSIKGPISDRTYRWTRPLSAEVREKLWECQEERFTYKACLRKMIELKKDPRTRQPVWQPEENYTRTIGRRLIVHEENRYPENTNHSKNDSDIQFFRKAWMQMVEEGYEVDEQ